ncbi:hypothetical protein CA51_19610 [Rosistilla oblonga]|uniref:Uncharacterized protein n=1 Tax=Rosistilla oblonga TaxID=2527990 RepID=A0A518ISK4_9BACT|nr:hypothetical protein CA51_19610 [Rosistilla oblonga]QDV56077.1 hypothetical protein Mal33_20560 [Rosistilla oblonga]
MDSDIRRSQRPLADGTIVQIDGDSLNHHPLEY